MPFSSLGRVSLPTPSPPHLPLLPRSIHFVHVCGVGSREEYGDKEGREKEIQRKRAQGGVRCRGREREMRERGKEKVRGRVRKKEKKINKQINLSLYIYVGGGEGACARAGVCVLLVVSFSARKRKMYLPRCLQCLHAFSGHIMHSCIL